MSDIEYRLFDPKEDFVFKALFGTEENKELLIFIKCYFKRKTLY